MHLGYCKPKYFLYCYICLLMLAQVFQLWLQQQGTSKRDFHSIVTSNSTCSTHYQCCLPKLHKLQTVKNQMKVEILLLLVASDIHAAQQKKEGVNASTTTSITNAVVAKTSASPLTATLTNIQTRMSGGSCWSKCQIHGDNAPLLCIGQPKNMIPWQDQQLVLPVLWLPIPILPRTPWWVLHWITTMIKKQ